MKVSHLGGSFLKFGLDVSASLILFLGIQFALHDEGSAIDRNLAAIQGPNVDIIGLLLNWDYYEGGNVNIEGKFECLTERFCDFVPTPWLSRIGWVDISRLASDDKRRLALSCHYICGIRLRGQVNSTDITALNVLGIEKK